MRHRGFTLIEMLVVIAITAVLLGLLFPAIGLVRESARQARCGSNLKSVAATVAIYTNTHRYFPLAYVYGADQTTGNWRPEEQIGEHPDPMRGYVHWSHALYDGLESSAGLPEEAFTCPTTLNGGAPRTNPGPNPDDWEPGQYNSVGGSAPSPLPMDRQAARMAYTGNAAIFPRNKLGGDSPRLSRFVKASEIDASHRGGAGVILATEYFDNKKNWTSLSTSGNGEIKSHRPLDPFLGVTAGVRVYDEPIVRGRASFVYPPRDSILEPGELDEHEILNSLSRLNAAGRHHGGKANFAFVDGHVALESVRETVRQRLWGDRFYSITGNNEVDLDKNEF